MILEEKDINKAYKDAEIALRMFTLNGDILYLKKAEKLLKSIIDNHSDYENISAVYVTYSSVLLNKHMYDILRKQQKSNKKTDSLRIISTEMYEELLKYNDLAMEAKKTNRVAPHQRLMIHLAYGNFKDAKKQLEKLDEQQIEEGLIPPYAIEDSDQLEEIIKTLIFEKGYYDKDLMEFLQTLLERVPNHDTLVMLSSIYPFAPTKDDKKEALNFCMKMVDRYEEYFIVFSQVICNLSISLQKYDLCIKQGEAFIKRLNEYKKEIKVPCAIIKMERPIRDSVALAYLALGKLDKSYQVRKKIDKNLINNTLLHNMGLLLLRMKKYEESIEYFKKALFIYEDETSYEGLGDAYFATKNYKDSLECYSRALSFIEKSEKYMKVEDNGMNFVSFLADESTDIVKSRLYENIIHCYMQLEEYTKADIYNQIASRKFVNNSQFEKNKDLIKLLQSKDKTLKNNDVEIKKVNKELERLSRYSERMGKLKEWALDLMNIQNSIDADDEWSIFELKILKLVEENIKNKNNDKVEINKIRKILKSKYYMLEYETLNFLATAEFLYKTYDGEMIDYAPIVIEYCKAVEVELNSIIRNSNRENYGYMTIGKIKYNIDKEKHESIYQTLSDLIEIRNKSAHSGSCDKDDAEYVRTVVVDDFIKVVRKNKYKNSKFMI